MYLVLVAILVLLVWSWIATAKKLVVAQSELQETKHKLTDNGYEIEDLIRRLEVAFMYGHQATWRTHKRDDSTYAEGQAADGMAEQMLEFAVKHQPFRRKFINNHAWNEVYNQPDRAPHQRQEVQTQWKSESRNAQVKWAGYLQRHWPSDATVSAAQLTAEPDKT